MRSALWVVTFRVFAAAAALSLSHCSALLEYLPFYENRDEVRNERLRQLLIVLGILQSSGEYYARLYYINPLITGSTTNENLVVEATTAHGTPGKKKLVLVHGWHFDDRDAGAYPTLSQLKDRILTQNWSSFFGSTEFSQIVATKSYDVYAFDYLTSNGIDINGQRFRAKMDSLFSDPADAGKVVLYAHSMGGLVTRYAVYAGGQPGYVARVISTGTPYHGSPWASPEFQVDRAVLGSLAGFVTGTTGGSDLRWDNYDGKLSGASNPKLAYLNSVTDRDALWKAYYGAYNATGTATCTGGTGALLAACALMGSNFEPSDCIVPSTSGSMTGHTLGFGTLQVGTLHGNGPACGLDHLDIKMGTSPVRAQFVADLP